MATRTDYAATTTTPETRTRWSSSRLSEGQFASLLALPVIIVLLAVVAYPTVYSLWMSFQHIDLIFKRTDAVGFANYVTALTPPGVWHSVWVTLYYTVLVTVFALVIAVGGALLLNEKFRGRGFLMALVILPWAVSLYATAIVWKYIYSPEWGLLNAVLLRIGAIKEPILFLSEKGAVPSIAIAHAWQIAPLGLYFVLATLQVIPEDLYKAAKVDRLGPVGRFRHVVLPYIKMPLAIVMVMITVEAARVFDLIFFMTNGGPGDASTTLTWDVYRQSFVNRDLGYGSAIGWILVLIITVITTIYFILMFTNRSQRASSQADAAAPAA
ncbi:MAG: sugar ABC transporter permease [Thermomicrobiales bacterium]|nr:sugar ABC transporter permease [Thermomicrobiales bacterium]